MATKKSKSALPCACTTVRKANRALFRFYEDAMRDSGVTVTQFAILRTLERNGPTELSRLADELVMERTSLYRTIEPLTTQRAILVKPPPSGRAKTATLTKAGVNLIRAALPFWESAQSRVIELIGQTEWKALSKVLLTIPEVIEKEKQ